MDPTPTKPDAEFWRKVEEARRMPPREKTFAGLKLLEAEVEQMRREIRAELERELPERVEQELWRRLEVRRQREKGW